MGHPVLPSGFFELCIGIAFNSTNQEGRTCTRASCWTMVFFASQDLRCKRRCGRPRRRNQSMPVETRESRRWRPRGLELGARRLTRRPRVSKAACPDVHCHGWIVNGNRLKSASSLKVKWLRANGLDDPLMEFCYCTQEVQSTTKMEL